MSNATTYEIRHHTEYRYDHPVSLSLQILRMTPRFGAFRQHFEIHPPGKLRHQRDALENPVAVFEWIGETDRFCIENQLTCKIDETNPFDFLLEARALEMPVSYNEEERTVLAPALDSGEADARAARLAHDLFPSDRECLAFVSGLNQSVHNRIRYEPRDEPGVQSPTETLERGIGSCRDYAALFMALARSRGLAARFVSGYLLKTGDETDSDNALLGAEAMHAWAELYLPGTGWKGFDPTNGILTDATFLPCAVSLDPLAATPVEGRFYSETPTQSHISTRLEISNKS